MFFTLIVGPNSTVAAAGHKDLDYIPPTTNNLFNSSIDIEMVVDKIASQVRSTGGVMGFCHILQKFRICDQNDISMISIPEFRKVMKEMDCQISDSDIRTLFKHFNADSLGRIDYLLFMQFMINELPSRRYKIVENVWEKISSVIGIDSDGAVSGALMADYFNENKHPDVMAGRVAPERALQTFLDTFDVNNTSGKVIFEEFLQYYTYISPCIDSDEYFQLFVESVWNGDDNGDIDNDVAIATVRSNDGSNNKSVSFMNRNKLEISTVVDQIRRALLAEGEYAYLTLHGILVSVDNYLVTTEDLLNTCNTMNMNLSSMALEVLCDELDPSGKDKIYIDDLMNLIKAPMNDYRVNLVKNAFKVLDYSGKGLCRAAIVANSFDAFNHPDVISGKVSANKKKQEFLKSFHVGKTKEGMVTLEEFIEHYSYVSANIKEDGRFESLLRAVWNVNAPSKTNHTTMFNNYMGNKDKAHQHNSNNVRTRREDLQPESLQSNRLDKMKYNREYNQHHRSSIGIAHQMEDSVESSNSVDSIKRNNSLSSGAGKVFSSSIIFADDSSSQSIERNEAPIIKTNKGRNKLNNSSQIIFG